MNVSDAIQKRRSVRKYKDIPINDSVLEEIIQDACWAPSAVNLQPWYYVVVRSEDGKKRVLEKMSEVAKKTEPSLTERFSKHPDVVKDTLRFIENLGDAPVIVLAFLNKKELPILHDGAIQSVAAANENLLLSAYAHDVSGCWMTAPVEALMGDDFRNEFAPERGELVSIITLGYAADGAIPAPPRRKDDRYVFV